MKAALSLLFLVIGSISFAQTPPTELVAVSNVDVVTTPGGCGTLPQPNRDPQPCPGPRTTVRFVVPFGGTCHTYSARIAVSEHGNFLTIEDQPLRDCTRPEERNYHAEVSVSTGLRMGSTVLVQNPTYVSVRYAPRP